MTKERISLKDLSEILRELKDKKLECDKSTLDYYTRDLGLLKPIEIIGRMRIFDKKEAIERIKFIRKKQAEGKTLEEIKNEINEMK